MSSDVPPAIAKLINDSKVGPGPLPLACSSAWFTQLAPFCIPNPQAAVAISVQALEEAEEELARNRVAQAKLEVVRIISFVLLPQDFSRWDNASTTSSLISRIRPHLPWSCVLGACGRCLR